MKSFAAPLLWIGLLLAPLAVIATSHPLPSTFDLEKNWKQYFTTQAEIEPELRYPHEHCFRQAAEKFELPLTLLLAIARGESDFNPRARSNRDAYGLMQIRWPVTAKHLGIQRLNELYDPCTNVQAGARYLRELLNRYQNNLHLALAAYNYGPGNIQVGARASEIPKGAHWYSSYIYRHLQYVQGRSGAPEGERVPYDREGKLEILVFHRPYRAEAFISYLKAQAPSLRLDWFHIGLNRFRVVLLYRNRTELSKGKQLLQNFGVSLSR